jgi:hypothetical protein
MDVLQINYTQFAMQILALSAWVCIAAGLYAIGEKFIEGRKQ